MPCDKPVARLGGARAGGTAPVLVMGIINASPESFYGASVRTTRRAVAAAAARMQREGADIIDVGGMSTAPYLETMIPEGEEAARVAMAVEAVRSASSLPVSVDTCRAAPAEAALERGATIVNDVTGLRHDPGLSGAVSGHAASVVVCAHAARAETGGWRETRALLEGSVEIARDAGVPRSGIAVDPALGFFRGSGRGRLFTRTGGRGGRPARASWVRRDMSIIRDLRLLRFGYPVAVSASAKSFIGAVIGSGAGRAAASSRRTAGSLSCEAAAVLNGADIVRTHNVAGTAAAVAAASSASGRASGRRPARL